MKNSNLNQIFKLSLKNLKTEMIFYDLILNFLLSKNFSLLSTRNPQQSYQADVPIPSLSLTSLSEAELHLTIRPVSTKMSKQTQASVISKRAGRRTPLTPTPKPLRTCKRLQPKRFTCDRA